ncbi:homocitrate synthase [Mycobacterium sp. 21AC1]|uniref:homocitrate synthase n=1 Tax=[Mycobacterium] appelbergii TaxID=2939269 RepID=UPI002938DEEF|nr:homocitrate synthase [Mycobacterium sp. 21AC1]MDV3127050.1 homocitrate synthase [Mycobacterium sp. 21AC1]
MHTSSATQSASFAASFAMPLPRGLREAGQVTSWDGFLATYAPCSGPLRLGNWTCTDGQGPARRLGPQVRNYQATLAIGDTICTSSAAASGPVGALTAMLHERGIAVETTSFHQLPTGGQTATFLRGSDGTRTEWAMGLDGDPVQSALRAVIACANRLMSTAGTAFPVVNRLD